MQMTKVLPMMSVGLALFLGALFSLMLGGFGPGAARLSVGTVSGALVGAFVVSWVGAVFLETRWLASLLFSVPLLLAMSVPALSHQWGRCLAMFACVVVSFLVVALFGRDRRR
jgi:hypothetical protein